MAIVRELQCIDDVSKKARWRRHPPAAGRGRPPKRCFGCATLQPNLIDILTVIAEKADPIVKLLSTSISGYQQGKEREVKHQRYMALVAVSVVVLIVGVSSFLTYRGKIDGSTFTFLLGLIVGYVLTFVRDQITGPE
jgi:hypothetical protein